MSNVLPQRFKTGDVLHCRGKRLLSKLIMWATESRWSHTAIFIEVWGQPYIIEAQGNGVNLKPFDQWEKKYGYYYEVSRNPFEFDAKKFSLYATSKVGTTGYDFLSLLVRQPWRILTGSYKVRKDEYEKMYCSEYVMWTHGIETAYRMSPQDVWDYCEDNDWIIIK